MLLLVSYNESLSYSFINNALKILEELANKYENKQKQVATIKF